MSSSSFVDIMQDDEGYADPTLSLFLLLPSANSEFEPPASERRTEFPFPVVEPRQPRSPSSGSDSTPPYMSRSLPEHRSSSSSSRRHRHTQRHRDRDRDGDKDLDEHDRRRDADPAKLFYRLAARDELRGSSDTKHVRTLLVLTNDRLETETRRADQAEQRVVDVLHRLRAANEATALAQADAVRAQQEVRLYQIQLEQAQREITRAQDIVDEVERVRREAEEEAARARTIARKCREDLVLSRAREEGRKQGYLEGLERGRKLGFTEAQSLSATTKNAPLRPLPLDDDEDMEVDEVQDSRRRAEVEPERRAASVPIPQVRRATPPRTERYLAPAPPPPILQPPQ